MRRLLALAAAAGDRVNPVAVKEFRQAVQSKWVVIIFVLFLVINLTVLGGYLMLSGDTVTTHADGRGIFQGLLAILFITCMSFVPLYTAIRLSLERNDSNIDLFFVTTITPASIIRGKYLTAMALTLLIFSACMPFFALIYFLRGIDLPTIFSILAVGFIFCAAANALGVFAGAVSGSWLIRGIVDLGVLIALGYLIVGSVAMSFESVMRGWRYIYGPMSPWAFFGTWFLVETLAIGLLYVFSVAMLSPKPSNRMLVPRIYITVCWAITGVVALLWTMIELTFVPVTVWMVGSGAALICMMVISMNERDAWSARVRRTIPRNIPGRIVAFLFFTGSAGGVVWCVLLFAATMSASYLVSNNIPATSGHSYYNLSHFQEVFGNLSIVFGYILCYCMMIAFVRLTVLNSFPSVNLSVLTAFFGMFVSVAPYLLAFIMQHDWNSSSAWFMLGSPLVLAMDYEPAADVAGPLVVVWLILGVLASAPWAIGQWRRFKPYRASDIDETADQPTASPSALE